MKSAFTDRVKRNKVLAVVFGIVGILLAGALFYQIGFQKPTHIIVKIKGSPGNWWWVTPRPPDWLAYSIHKGDKEYNAANRPIAEVLSVDVYDSGGSTRDVYLTARLEVRHNPRTNQYRYKGETLEIGGPISMSLNGSFFPGMVVANYGDQMPQKNYVEKTIRVRHKDRWPYEYDAIRIGDTIKDGDGIVISEIVDKYKTPAIDEEPNVNGQLVRTSSPIHEDFYVTLKMRFQERDGEFIYREEQFIKVGNFIWLMFPNYNMSAAEVLSIE